MLQCKPVNLCPVNGLTRRKENSPEVEEDKMALSAFSEFLALSAFSRTLNLEAGLMN
jgi:hypothetical protein